VLAAGEALAAKRSLTGLAKSQALDLPQIVRLPQHTNLPPTETTKTITIEVKGDRNREANETFYLDLFGNSSNALFAKNRDIGTILNDDGRTSAKRCPEPSACRTVGRWVRRRCRIGPGGQGRR
jgi:hypothetical protein